VRVVGLLASITSVCENGWPTGIRERHITTVCEVGWGGFIMSGAKMYGFNPKEVEHKISATVERCPDKSIWTFQCLCTKVFTIVNTDPNAKIMGYYCTRCRRPLIVTAGFDVDPNSKFRD